MPQQGQAQGWEKRVGDAPAPASLALTAGLGSCTLMPRPLLQVRTRRPVFCTLSLATVSNPPVLGQVPGKEASRGIVRFHKI